MSADDFADAPAGRSAGINRGFDGADFTADDGRDQPGIDLFPANQRNVGGFHRRVGELQSSPPGRGIQLVLKLLVPFYAFQQFQYQVRS